MTDTVKKLSIFILFIIFLIGIVGASSMETDNYPSRGAWAYKTPNGTYVYWNWYLDEWEDAINSYYFILHCLTGWNVPVLEYLESVSPEDLATMPVEMYDSFSNGNIQMFSVGSIMQGEKGTWQFINFCHIWISPEGDVYSGDRPPYQWLVWKGWEEYAGHLPEAPPGAPFPAPSYSGTPRNTLPIVKIPPHTGNFYGPIDCPFPGAIADSDPHSEWEWTPEMKDALSTLGLDNDMGKTRLGYEKSGTTIRMVGMTPSGTMKEWTLVMSKGAWTCDSADARELEAMLFILEKIGAIFNMPASVAPPAAMEGAPSAILKTQVMASRSLPEVPSISSLKGQFPDRKNAVIDPVVNATVLAQRPATVVQTAGRVSYQANVKRPEIITSIPAPSVPDLPLHVKYPGIPSRIPSRTAGSR